MRVLNTCKIPFNIAPITVLEITSRIHRLDLKDRNLFSFRTNNMFVSDLITSKSFGPNTNILTAATENIFGYPCIVHIFSGFPAEYNQLDFYLGNNEEYDTRTFEDYILWLQHEDMQPFVDETNVFELQDLLYFI